MRASNLITAIVLALISSMAGAPYLPVLAAGTGQVERAPKKHPVDQPTKDAMTEIRNLVADNHSLVTHRRMPKAMALKMSSSVQAQINSIRKNSTLQGDARMEMSAILADLETGAKAVAGESKEISQIDGIVLMDEALAQYANQFEHPGWKAPREL